MTAPVIVRDPEGKETSVPVDKIKERSPVISTMPPMGFTRSST